MKYDLLDTTGRFEEKYSHLNGMFLDQRRDDDEVPKTLMTLHAADCKKDALDGGDGEAEDASGRRLQEKTETHDTHKNRKRIFGYARIDLQFDWRNEVMAYWR